MWFTVGLIFLGVNFNKYDPNKKSINKIKNNENKSWAENFFINLVAGSGIEPLTSGLWVPRSNQLSYPAIKFVLIYTTYFFSFKQEIKKLRLIRVSLWTTSGPKLDQKFWSMGRPCVIKNLLTNHTPNLLYEQGEQVSQKMLNIFPKY